MAMSRKQPNVHAKDMQVSGVTNSVSVSPGEKRAISGAATCGSMGTAMASARNPAHRPSAASKRERNSLPWSITADSSRGFRGASFQFPQRAAEIPAELKQGNRTNEGKERYENHAQNISQSKPSTAPQPHRI